MQCPTCNKMYPSRGWRPSQWQKWTPVVGYYHQCKVCDGEILAKNVWGWTVMPTPPTTAPPPQTAPRPDSTPAEAVILVTIAKLARHAKFSDFFVKWMAQSYRARKDLSYSGALRCQPGDPVHYTCLHTGETYFDPMNMIYSTAMCFLAPHGLLKENWNTNTRGDICESLLGYAYQLAHRERADPHALWPLARAVAQIIEITSRLTHQLSRSLGHADFHDCCTWIIKRAAYLSQRGDVENVVAAILPQDAAMDAPRPKLIGVLNEILNVD